MEIDNYKFFFSWNFGAACGLFLFLATYYGLPFGKNLEYGKVAIAATVGIFVTDIAMRFESESFGPILFMKGIFIAIGACSIAYCDNSRSKFLKLSFVNLTVVAVGTLLMLRNDFGIGPILYAIIGVVGALVFVERANRKSHREQK